VPYLLEIEIQFLQNDVYVYIISMDKTTVKIVKKKGGVLFRDDVDGWQCRYYNLLFPA
jgi:hypothetical protein